RTGEGAAPETAQIKGNYNRTFYIHHCAFKTAVEFTQMTIAADGTFGKETYNLALVQEFADACQRFLAVTGRDGNHPQTAEQRFQIPAVIDFSLHHETNGARAGDLYQSPVDPADVVAQQQHTAARRQIVKVHYVYAIALTKDQTHDKAHEGMGQLFYCVACAYHCHQCQQTEKQRTVKTKPGKHQRQAEKAEHGDVLYPVIARQHCAQFMFSGVILDECIEGNHEESTHHTQHQKIQCK